MTLKGRHRNRAMSKPTMEPRVYKMRKIKSFKKPSGRPDS